MPFSVLVVDDEQDVRALVEQWFRREIRERRYHFDFCDSGASALAWIKANGCPDVVLSDIRMPGMDGLELLRHVAEADPVTRAVIISAFGDMGNIRTAMNRGAYDFLIKPIDVDDLRQTLAKAAAEADLLRRGERSLNENVVLKQVTNQRLVTLMEGGSTISSLLLNETIDATVSFIDLCGFTSFAEAHEADVTVELLNRSFGVMIPLVLGFDGQVDKFLGDALMVVFRGQDHLQRAVDAALAIRSRMDHLAKRAGRADDYFPRVSIGLDSGEMVSGAIGSLELERMDFTVVGDVVNTAARLESLAEAGQVMTRASVYRRIEEDFDGRPVGSFSLRNKREPVDVVEILERF